MRDTEPPAAPPPRRHRRSHGGRLPALARPLLALVVVVAVLGAGVGVAMYLGDGVTEPSAAPSAAALATLPPVVTAASAGATSPAGSPLPSGGPSGGPSAATPTAPPTTASPAAPTTPGSLSASRPPFATPAPFASPSIEPSPAPAPGIVAKRIVIDRLGIDLPIVKGDGIDAPLGKAAHYPGTGWPTGGTNIYLYAHARDGAFIGLWSARIGDTVDLQLADGTTKDVPGHPGPDERALERDRVPGPDADRAADPADLHVVRDDGAALHRDRRAGPMKPTEPERDAWGWPKPPEASGEPAEPAAGEPALPHAPEASGAPAGKPAEPPGDAPAEPPAAGSAAVDEPEWHAVPPERVDGDEPSGARGAGGPSGGPTGGASRARPRKPPRSRRQRRRRRALILVLILTLLGTLIGAAVILVANRYLPALDEAKALRTDIEAVVARVSAAGLDLDRATLAGVRSDLDRANDRLARLDDLLRRDPLIGLARDFPPTRDAVAGADGVVAAGTALAEAARDGLVIGDRYVTIREQHATGAGGDSTLAELVALMATSQDQADRTLADLERARTALASVPVDVPGPIDQARDEMLARLDQYQPLLATYAELDDRLPAILGWDRPVRYLVLTQDPAELRPSGGYIGSFGLVSIDKGRITERTFKDVFLLDLPWKYRFLDPPPDLVTYLLGPDQPWQLADANWSPDFPTAARDALRLYTNESQDTNIDGVLAITTQTIDQLLTLTGPVTVPGWDLTIAPGETTLAILRNTRVGEIGERKAILGALADQLFASLLALPPKQWATLAGDAETFRTQRLLQAWFADPAAQAFVADRGWSGAVRTDPGDYVYPVDSNVLPVSKLNMVTTRSLSLDIHLDEVGNARSAMGLSWQNAVDTPAGADLRAMTVGVGSLDDLGLFVRVLVPERSRLEQTAGGSYVKLTGPAIEGTEAGRFVFGNYLRVPPGTTTVQYTWVSPYAANLVEGPDGNATGGEYHLVIQKQPGLRGGPLTLSITVPPGMIITDASTGLQVSGGIARLDLPAFDSDVVLGIRFAGAIP